MSRLSEKLADAWRLALHHALRMTPVSFASLVGVILVQCVVRTSRRHVISAARKNLKFHRPDATDAQINRSVNVFLNNIGRVMAEFSVLDKILAKGRVRLNMADSAHALAGKAPVIGLCLHTGNWEIFGPALRQAGWPFSSFYAPPENGAERRIAEAVRRKMGFELLTPDLRGVRRSIELLRQNATVAIFVDEARAGCTLAPLFGRPPHAQGNLAIAARLARSTGAQFVIFHCERIEACRFQLHISAPFALSETNEGLLSDVAFLNDQIEPVVFRNLDSWYFLDDELAPIVPAPSRAART